MKCLWRKAIAASCVFALVATGCSHDKKDEPQQSEHVQIIGTESKDLTFPDGINVAVPQGTVATDTHLAITEPATSSLALLGETKTAIKIDVSLEQGNKKDIQPLRPMTLSVDLTGAWIPDGAKPQDAKVYTPVGGHLWLTPSKVEGTKLTISLGHLSPKYITYVSDADLVKSFDANRVKKDPGSCAQQMAVDGGKVKFGPNSKGWSTKSDSPILACLSKGSDGYVRVGIVNRIPYVLMFSAESDFRIEEAPGNADAELIKLVTRRVFGIETEKLVAEGDTLVGSVKIDDLPSTITVKADVRTFFADVIIRDVRLLLDFLRASPTPMGELTELLDKMLGSSNVISCFQDLVEESGSNPDQGTIAFGSIKCLMDPMIEYISSKFGLGDLWAAIQFIKDGLGNLAAAAKYAWVGVFVIKGSMQVSVVAEMEAKFTHWLRFAGLNLPLYSKWKTKAEATDAPSVYDMSTCRDLEEDHWKLCGRLYIQADMVYTPEQYRLVLPCTLNGAPTMTSIGGERAYHYVFAQCDELEISYQMHQWLVPSRGVVISYTIPARGKEMKGLDKALASATWD